jgi:hypothetical protein
MKKVVIGFGIGILLLGSIFLLYTFKNNKQDIVPPKATSNTIVVNPPKEVQKTSSVVKTITNTIHVPVNTNTGKPDTTKVTVTDDNGNVQKPTEVTVNDDSSVDVKVDTTIAVVQSPWKIVVTPDSVGLGYQYWKYSVINFDVMLTTKEIGTGISYDITQNLSAGVMGGIDYQGNGVVKVYVSGRF